jgi:Transglycosylase SLT domain
MRGRRNGTAGADPDLSPTILHLRWRGVAAALPALALLGGGLALAGSGAPGGPTQGAGAPVTRGASLPVVPSTPFTAPGTAGDPPGLKIPPAPAGRSGSVTLDSQGIPGVALAAYHTAAGVVGNADPSCHIDWALIAAIGRVESDHGRYGGSALDAQGIDRPGIYGIELDGRDGTASIHDSDHGVYDHDTVWDRAVGPMQFIPSTWRIVGGDLDGDGAKNPQDINDAAAATAIYLCAGPGDLARTSDAYAAVLRYNDSDSYATTVLAIASAYRRGVTMLPLSDLPAASGAEKSGASGKDKAAKGKGTAKGGSAGSGSGAGKSGSSASPTGAPPNPASGGGSNPGSGVASVVSKVGSVVPTTLPSPVTSLVCTVAGAGGGLGLPTLPIPGCPSPTTKPGH